MPEDVPSRSDSTETYDQRHLPVVISPAEIKPRSNGENWLYRLARLFGWKSESDRSDIDLLLDARQLTDLGFSPEERAMLKNILGLSERPVEDVMIPRADIVAVQKDMPLGELMKIFEKAGHSRLVVFDDTLDDPVGLVHIRDLIGYMTAQATINPAVKSKRKKHLPADLDLRAIDLAMPLAEAKLIRTVLFVPPSMPTLDLLAKMQATRIHLALVIDEYGGTDGLVSLEDLVEQIVGDIEDEHDEQEAHTVVRQPDGSFLADARATLEDAIATIGTEFDIGDAAEEVDTLGGYLVTRIGRVPVRGEIVPGPDPFEIEVLDADPRRVKKIKISRSKQQKPVREMRREPEDDGGARAAASREPGNGGLPESTAGTSTVPSGQSAGPDEAGFHGPDARPGETAAIPVPPRES
ncbi:MAG: hemolysin family protein [Xanthobacteraceae bacterium]